MFSISPSELAQRLAGRLKQGDLATPVTGFATDSRHVLPGDAYIAIKGARSDGHDFAEMALEKGAALLICEKPISGPRIEVESVVKSLARFGHSYRTSFTGPVVGITGSNGKSTCKELSFAAMSPLGVGIKTEANRNTEYTSPLIWAEFDGKQTYAVIEMGMRGFGQIAHLAEISEPTIGVVTMVGTAHVEMVGSREGIAKAKGELLERLVGPKVSVLWCEDAYLDTLKEYSPGPVVTFGFDQAADCRIVGNRSTFTDGKVQSEVRCEVDGRHVDICLPYVGRHNALNAACALLVAHVAGVEVDQAASAMAGAEAMPMRMQILDWKGVTLLLDAYNASPDSTVAALRTLVELPCAGRRVAILGEMKELGAHNESGHRSVGEVLADLSVDEVFLTGGSTELIYDSARAKGFPESRLIANKALDLDQLEAYLRTARPGDLVLIKGSRALGLERAVEAVIR